jgi:hypothetical protein
MTRVLTSGTDVIVSGRAGVGFATITVVASGAVVICKLGPQLFKIRERKVARSKSDSTLFDILLH